MEVILNTEIARLVLDYLRDQNLNDVCTTFCKYSPYLLEEYELLKKGLLPINIRRDSLLQICREYCLINVNVNKSVELFPINIQDAFAKKNLIGKVTYLLKLATKHINSSITETTTTSDNVKNKKNKRRRSQITADNSINSIETTQVEDLPGFCPSSIKKRRLSASYYFLQDVQSASSEDSSEDDDSLPINTSTSATTTVDNQQQSNLQQINTNSTLQSVANKSTSNTAIQISNPQQSNLQQINSTSSLQSSTIYTLNQLTEPPVIIDTPKPKSSIVFNTNQINNTLQTPGPLNSTEQNGNSICTPSLIDPNFSISKLIIMNQNDTTTESIFNTTNGGLSPFTSEQVFIDLGTGQAYPFLVTNDGMNCMFINRTDIETNNVQPMLSTSGILTGTTNIVTTAEIQESIKNKSTIFEKQIPQSLDSKIIKENSTPTNDTNTNQPITRSLSTPRRKSSHVRVLNFSPLTKITEQSSSGNPSNVQQENIQPIVTTRPIIESVQILPQLQKPLSPSFIATDPKIETVTQTLPVENECSNSNSTDLTGGEHSNVTVIQRKNIDTPHRKPNLRSCKRVISRSNSEDACDDGKNSIKKTKRKINKNKISPKKKISPKINLRKKKKPNKEEIDEKMVEDKQMDPMEEWRQMRLKTKSGNFDQHLREISAKISTVGRFRHDSKRRKVKKHKVVETDNKGFDTKANSDDSPDSPKKTNSNEEIDGNKIRKDATGKQMLKSDSKTLFNFKIKTPIKINSPNKNHSKKFKSPFKKCIMTKKNISEIEENQEIFVKEDNKVKNYKELTTNTEEPYQKEQESSTSNVHSSIITKEREKRTANIAHILDTPFKIESSQFPTTPKFIQPQNIETPATKLLQITSFSTLKHLDIKTPAFAITPGSSLTPADKETPKSGCLSSIQTDYSSGGSYYRPDESEDLDKQLDRNLNAEMRKRRLHKSDDPINKISFVNTPTPTTSKESSEQENNQKNEITPETIVPCPVVLEKVKCFSDEKPNVIPHYKFSDALPELTDESTTSSSSSSSSSSPSSASTSSSSSSSTSSSTRSSKSNKTLKSKKSLFSEINSSEDEDWEIQSEKIKELDEENSQLVTNDGEVRFPVRSWITPKKPDDVLLKTTPKKLTTTTTLKIANDSMISIYDEKFKQKAELESKRQRMKEQLAEDFKNSNIKQQKKTPTSKKFLSSIIIQNENKMEKSKNLKEIVKEKIPENRDNQIEVLTALQLSARKKPINEMNDQQKQQNLNILPNLDDNATSDVFTNCIDDENSQHSATESLKVRNAALALTSMQQKKKLTLPIEPLPMKQMRGRPRKIPINTKPDKKKPIKGKIIKKEPLKILTIKLRRETSMSPNLLQKEKTMDKEKLSKLTENGDPIKRIKSNEIFEPQPSTSKCTSYLPPIQSSEIRSSVEETELTEKLISHPISSTSKLEEEIVQVRSATDIQKDLNRHESSEENIVPVDCQNNDSSADDSEEEEDPYEACKLITSDHFQMKTIKYTGPDNYCPDLIKNQFNLKYSITNINLCGVLHKLQCTEPILLFSKLGETDEKNNVKSVDTKKDNKKIKTVPKKRERNVKFMVNKSPDLCPEKLEPQRPQSTSTPLLPKIKISHKNNIVQNKLKSKNIENKNNLPGTSRESRNLGECKTDKILTSDEVSSSVSTSIPTANVTKTPGKIVDAQGNFGNNIRAEDISAVLSHLHGNE